MLISEVITRKVEAHHLAREACLYVRQSSLRQVVENTESARRQYGLRHRAMALGWPAESVRVIDEDQGKSAASSANRSGFRDLMARIAAGEVGIVLGLEVSRLARNNADWHQLLRIAGIARTLILDENGVYDPNDSNDRLLLGFKGTMSEFELQGIRARLVGGQKSAAARGVLKMALPIGLAYDDNDEVVLDPDLSIADAIGGVFDRFRRLGSAMAVVKWMHRENIVLPSRPRRGPNRGQLRWALPSFSQVRQILRNPRYAGAYVYGRTRSEPQADGKVRHRSVPREEWQVLIRNAHAGFIDWDEYLRNQATLAANAAAFLPAPSRVAAPRKGAALLQSRVICGHCGRRMGPLYTTARSTRNEPARYFYVCKHQLVRYGRKVCQTIRADLVDAAISRFVVDAMNRENIDLAIAIQEQVRVEFAEADRQRAHRIEAIRYEADLARRRFFAVDPANRLVAATLEADWNGRLRELEDACGEREARAAARDAELSGLQRERIRALTRDFEQVWTASQTTNTDRKRLLGLLIEDATLSRDGYEVKVELRVRGGRALTLDTVHLPRPMAQIRKTPPAHDRSSRPAPRDPHRRGHRTGTQPGRTQKLEGRVLYGQARVSHPPQVRVAELSRTGEDAASGKGIRVGSGTGCPDRCHPRNRAHDRKSPRRRPDRAGRHRNRWPTLLHVQGLRPQEQPALRSARRTQPESRRTNHRFKRATRCIVKQETCRRRRPPSPSTARCPPRGSASRRPARCTASPYPCSGSPEPSSPARRPALRRRRRRPSCLTAATRARAGSPSPSRPRGRKNLASQEHR